MQIFGFLGSLLGYVLWGAFYLLKDFGLSIIVFTIIVRLCMFPFTIKQQKSMAGTARLSKKQKEILELSEVRNTYTDEKVYQMTLECNNMVFRMAINEADLLGEPAVGRRFKGQVWLQGRVQF